jgi:hypothetical protein
MIWKFSNLNKHGNIRSRIIYRPDGEGFKYYPKGLGSFIDVVRFKYEYKEQMIPPHLFTGSDGKKFIVPTWQEVLPETTLDDINWIRTEIKTIKPEKNEWLFESSSDPGLIYKVTQVGNKLNCNCPGVWRSKDRQCKHIKEVIKDLGI